MIHEEHKSEMTRHRINAGGQITKSRHLKTHAWGYRALKTTAKGLTQFDENRDLILKMKPLDDRELNVFY